MPPTDAGEALAQPLLQGHSAAFATKFAGVDAGLARLTHPYFENPSPSTYGVGNVQNPRKWELQRR